MKFTVRNIAKDEEALAELERMRAMSVPVAVIDGEEVVVGFDREKLERTLGL